jgi:hypothetical protein
MSEILLQYVTIERTIPAQGRRILQDGTLQTPSPENPLPGVSDLLEKDRPLTWVDLRQLSPEELDMIREAIRKSGIFGLPARILINYCKEDPGTQIWTIDLDGQNHRVVLYDPRPRRAAEIDALLAALAPIVN